MAVRSRTVSDDEGDGQTAQLTRRPAVRPGRSVAGTVIRRALHLLGVLFIVSFATMLLVNLVPGDPVVSMIGPDATPQQVTALRHQLGLDESLPVRYVHWVGHALTGDLGRSIRTEVPVWTSIRSRIPVTGEIALLALLLSLVVAIPVGMLAADRPEGWFDRISGSFAAGFLASPPFLTALLLVFVLSVKFHIFPVSGWVPFTQNPLQNLRHLVLPVLAVSTIEMATFCRLLRGDMVDTLNHDYILTAKSVGLPKRKVLVGHALRPSSFTLLTVAAISLGRLIGGTVIVEQIFALPGLGQLVVSAINNKDLIVVQGVVLFTAVVYVVVNILVTLGYAWLDPRTRTTAGARGN
jgi:peptide/nickel transport system permease protein